MSRTVNGERFFDDTAKDILRRQLWQIADYCGVQIITYAVMSNHFHVLVRVSQKTAVDDRELLRRYHVLYPRPTKYQSARLEVIEGQLKKNGPDAEAWRKQQTALMGDVSQFMKLLKQRFSIWFDRMHGRFGPVWADRFKSVLVEGKRNILATMAAYIDLNCVRAGLADDPKDYRFCGYAEAVAGNKSAQSGLSAIFCAKNTIAWRGVQEDYRLILFGSGAGPRQDKRAISPEALEKVAREKGSLPLADILRCRVRYFTDGAVLGTKAFVLGQLALYKRRNGLCKRTAPRALPDVTDWGGMMTLRGMRKKPFG